MILTRRHRNVRLRRARKPMEWTQNRWNRGFFFFFFFFFFFLRLVSFQHVFFSDGRARVWRRPCERFVDYGVLQRHRFGWGCVMVWDVIWWDQKTRLILIRRNFNAESHIDHVLTPEVLPYMAWNEPGLPFQHDNVTPHAARISQFSFNSNGVNVLPWSSRSTDIKENKRTQVRIQSDPHQPRWTLVGWTWKACKTACTTKSLSFRKGLHLGIEADTSADNSASDEVLETSMSSR